MNAKPPPDRQSIRLRGYDYSQPGLYFITVCTQNRQCIFGGIVGARRDAPNTQRDRPGGSPALMELNEYGRIVKSVWQSLPDHHPVELDCFQIMPNHVHFVLGLTGGSHPNITGASRRAPTTLGMLVGFFKSESTKQIRQIVGVGRDRPGGSPAPVWQRNYFEQIIRNETDLEKIRGYVRLNPEMWARDRNNPSLF